MTHGQPSRPSNVENIILINQGKKPLALALPAPRALTVSEAQAQATGGAAYLDTRSSREFGAAHIPSAYNVQLTSSQFEQRVGWVIPGETPLILILADDAQASATLHKLAYIGLETRVTGTLAGGMDAWLAAGLPTARVAQQRVAELNDLPNLTVLDVREGDEWDAGHIAGARHLSYKHLDARLAELALDPAAPLAIICASGQRSSTAASLLLRRGFTDVRNVVGGMDAWKAAGFDFV